MGLTKRNFRSVGSTTYRGTGSGDNGSSGEGDSAFVPRARCRSGQRWPTFVLEAGYSQSLEGLRNNVRWWFAASQHEVKIVLVAKLYQATQEIRLEKYVKDVSQVRTGATHTRNTPQLQPRLTQVVTITPREAGPGQELQFTVVGAPLILEFRLLFLRAPNLDAGERDLEYTSSDLEDTAMQDLRAKFGIVDADVFNFDETGFSIGVIAASMVVTRAERNGKAKSLQQGNREWATVIQGVNAAGWLRPTIHCSQRSLSPEELVHGFWPPV